ncbi:MAG: hypothetical protein QNI99_03860 [Woeseiaceae bacterium]|nr:hypothetical protein [Woeseiaceae bacterium]
MLFRNPRPDYCSAIAAAAIALAGANAAAETDAGYTPAAGTTIGEIRFERQNIFDVDNPEENVWLYRLVNRFHILTRESTIRDQLLFHEGDVFDARQLEESARILRNNKYLFDATIEPSPNMDGTVDLTVTTRDVWSLTPELAFSRSGGENEWDFGFEESNLFGTGQRVLLVHSESVDRDANTFEYSNPQIGQSWVGTTLRLADASDGQTGFFAMTKPFHELDARTAGGVSVFNDDRVDSLYVLGERAAEYRQERDFVSAFVGISNGLQNGWVRRWTAGIVYDDVDFSEPRKPDLPLVLPENRKLVFPYLGFDIFEDRFEKASNFNQMERSEDFYFGRRFAGTLGWSETGFGSDRDALIYALTASRGFGNLDGQALIAAIDLRGRIESGDTANATSRIDLRYSWRQSDRMLFFARLDGTLGHDLDLDTPIEIGGNSGLRGYPLRYQSGDSRVLISMEQRYFTDWYPFRLVRVGAAVFADAGRTWGDDPLGGENLGWLTDVGFGLRLAPTRFGTDKVFHVDVAFPLDGDDSIDDVQILFEAKRSF